MTRKLRKIWLEVMFGLWVLGASVISVLIAIGLLFAGFIMKVMGKPAAQEDASKRKSNKYYMYE